MPSERKGWQWVESDKDDNVNNQQKMTSFWSYIVSLHINVGVVSTLNHACVMRSITNCNDDGMLLMFMHGLVIGLSVNSRLIFFFYILLRNIN